MKKILVVCQHFWPENFRINDICIGLKERNYDIDVLCGIPNYPTGEIYSGYSFSKKRKDTYRDINIKRVLEIPRKGNSNLRILLNYLSFPFFSLFHIPSLLLKKYDYIFIYELSPVMMALPGILLGKIKKIPITMYILDLWPENLFSVINIKSRGLRWIAYKASRWYYKNVNKLICISEAMQIKVEDIVKNKNIEVTTIPQFCEKIYEEEKSNDKLEVKYKDSFNILFTGNISPAQSFETIIEAAKLLKINKYKTIKFVIVGDGMSKEWVEIEVEKNKIGDMFAFEGTQPMEKIPCYFSIADGLIGCLTKSDLLGLTIPAKVTSYLASGKPLLLAMDGEAKKLVNKINCGFACDSEDSITLYENIIKLYHMSEDERKQLGINGRKYHFEYLERNKNLDTMIKFAFNSEI